MILNETHDPGPQSWVLPANRPDCDFPIQNLPFGVFRVRGRAEPFRGGVAIGDQIVDLSSALSAGAFDGEAAEAAAAASRPELNGLMALGPHAWSTLRLALSRALRAGSTLADRVRTCLVPQAEAEHAVPARIGDFTDFYTSIHHATRVGQLLRPDNPLLPNYKWMPIAYHGRSSSIAVSGARIPRPTGQVLRQGSQVPALMSSQRLDYELEIGAFVGPGSAPGTAISMADAEDHVFGLCLLNDWSARDVQAWEYQPLGPFLGKNFATTVSPWIVTLEALAPYRVPWQRSAEDPQPLPYLKSARNEASGCFDIELSVWLETAAMRRQAHEPVCISRSNFRDAYWSLAQMVTHHTVNGCNLRAGDLLGTGTLSGPLREQGGCLLELTTGDREQLQLPNGETRRSLEDGDAVLLRGHCAKSGAARIGFGEARGEVIAGRLA